MRHVDNTCSGGKGRLCNGRRLSAVYYLNPSWAAADGSALLVEPSDGFGPRLFPIVPPC